MLETTAERPVPRFIADSARFQQVEAPARGHSANRNAGGSTLADTSRTCSEGSNSEGFFGHYLMMVGALGGRELRARGA